MKWLENIKNKKDRLKKIIPAYIILIIFPCVFSFLQYYSILKIDFEHEINITKSKIYKRSTDFLLKVSPVKHFYKYFRRLSNNIFPILIKNQQQNNSFEFIPEISKEIKKVSELSGENFSCAVFDKNANLLNSENLNEQESRFFSFLWKYIHGFKDIDYKDREIDEYEIVGHDFTYHHLISPNEQLVPTFAPGNNGLLFIKKSLESQGGILIYLKPKSSLLDLIQSEIKDFSTEEQPIILFNSDKKQKVSVGKGQNDLSFDIINRKNYIDGFIQNKTFWQGIKYETYQLLFGQNIADMFENYRNKYYIAVFILILIIFVSAFIFYKNTLGNHTKGVFISIRYKLILIFLLAIYMPILSMFIMSSSKLESHRIAIENEVKKSMVDTLNSIDSNYKKYEERIFSQFSKINKYLKSFKGKNAPSYEEVRSEIEELFYGDFKIDWLDIRHIDQTQIYTTSGELGKERLQEIGRVISILCLEKFCPEKLEYAGIKPNQSDISLGNLLENPLLGFSSIIERPNMLNYLNYEGSGVYWWWNYYPELENPIGFCIGLVYSQDSIVSYFKTLNKKEFKYEDTPLKVIFFNDKKQLFVPEEYDTNNKKVLLDFINISKVNNSIESTTLTYDNEKYIALCVPGSNLKESFGLCLYPVYEIDRHINKIRSEIYTAIIFLLVIAILTGALLSKVFITPAKELNRGLEALKKRETNTLIHIENKDEFGQLGKAFNQMMAEIKDMLLAGSIQQCLIPTGKHNIEGYDCIIYNQMAADVGGDYADIIKLPENKYLIVIGDVTGHGVSSSLLTTMVKASVFRFVNKNSSLNEIVTKTSDMIFDLLNHKKMMTFCAISFDVATGELAICNAGHPNPIIKGKEKGNIRIIGKTTLPLGLSKKRCRYVSESELLNYEETLILYTDGFYEATNDKGEDFGFDNYKQLIAKASISSAEDLQNIFNETFKKHYGDKELADDVTYIILRRNPLQNN